MLIGTDRARFAGALARHAPDVPVAELSSTDTGVMDQAVAQAAAVARRGDTVLLAPAAQSWDMFRDYPARGDAFAAAVDQAGGFAVSPTVRQHRAARGRRRGAWPAACACRAAAPPVAGAAERASGLRDGALRLKALLDRPLASYYLVLGCSLLLLGVGLMMVLSTSTAYDLDQGLPRVLDVREAATRRGGRAGADVVAAKSPPRLFRAFAYPLLLAAIVGLVLVLLFGPEIDGAKRWLMVAGTQVQPSEFAKLALVLWGADLLARKEKLGQLTDWRHILVPLLPGAALMAMLVMIGKDLGTTFLLLVIFLSLLWVIGAPAKLLIGMVALMVFALLMLVAVHPYELARLTGFLSSHVAELPEPDLLPAGPGQGRARLRRPVRRGQRRQPGQVGLGARTARPTSSSPSSARNSAWSARSAWWCCTAGWPSPGCASRAGYRTRSPGWPPARSRSGSRARRW